MMGSKIWHLELTQREQFVPSKVREGMSLLEVNDAAINARFYQAVGQSLSWNDRLPWADEQWEEWVNRQRLKTWVAFFCGEEAGFVEMEIQDGGNVEIVYFGLLPSMIGKGLGSAMLTLAVQEAWRIEDTRRVWLHTCSEDHPHALANYEKRGFRLFWTEVL